MSKVSERLQKALELSGERSVRAVHRKLEEGGATEATYSTVHRYFSGEVEPPLSFLAAAADLLGVRRSWLALNEGPMTEAPDAIRNAVLGSAFETDTGTRGGLELLLGRVATAMPEGEAATDAELAELLDRLLRPVYDVWYALSGEGREDQWTGEHSDRRRLADYLVAAVAAMLPAVAEKGEGRPLQELLHLLPHTTEKRVRDPQVSVYMTPGESVARMTAFGRAHNRQLKSTKETDDA